MRRAALILAIIGMVCASLGIWAYQSLPTLFDDATHLHPTSPTKQVWSRYWAPTLPFLPSDGALVFSTRRPDPVLQGDAIVALALDGQLHEVDVATGHDRWNFSPDQGAFVDFAVDRGLIVGLGRYGVSASSGSQPPVVTSRLVAVDAVSGARRWAWSPISNVLVDAVSASGGQIYAVTHSYVMSDSDRSARRAGATIHVQQSLTALDTSDGAFLWQTPLPLTGVGGQAFPAGVEVMAYADAVIVAVPSAPPVVQALSSHTGKPVWTKVGTTFVVGSVPSRQVVLSTPGRVGDDIELFDVSSGSALGPPQPNRTQDSRELFLRDGVLFALGSAPMERLEALDLVHGDLRWWVQLDHKDQGFEPGYQDPGPMVYRDGHLYLRGRDACMYSLDASSGRFEWKFSLKTVGSSEGRRPVIGGSLVIVQDVELAAFRRPH